MRSLPLALGVAVLLLATAGCGGGEPEDKPCLTDGDCTLPDLCGEDGVCAAPEPAGEGTPCQHDAHCTSELCADVDGAGRRCLIGCDQRSACPDARPCTVQSTSDATQLLAICGAAESAGDRFLGEACTAHAQCRATICHEGACAELCGSCPPGFSCDERSLSVDALSLEHGVCRREPALRVVELGSAATPAAGVAEPLEFEITADDGPFVLYAVDEDDLKVAIRRLEAPDGTVLLDIEDGDDPPDLMRASAYIGLATVLVPGSDDSDAALQPGTYKLWLGTYDPENWEELDPVDGDVERVALVFRRWGERGGLLDLTVHLSPGTGLTAAEAAESPYLRQALGRLDGLYRNLIGASLGRVQYRDLGEAYDVIETGDDARALASSHGDGDPHGLTINVFLVQQLAFAGGFAGTAPGPTGLYGRTASGIVAAKQGSAAVMGVLLAHEIGHYLGLWHTTETTGDGDPIGDTPVCPPETSVKDCPDYRNLMFPQFTTSDPITLSAGQQQVVRGSPWLYQLSYPDGCGGAGVVEASSGFASGSTAGVGDGLEGSCGGAGRGERAHLFRVSGAPETLEVWATGHGFRPAVYVLRGACDAAQEVACAAAEPDGSLAELVVDTPAAGRYFVVVDGVDGAGRYELTVRATYPE